MTTAQKPDALPADLEALMPEPTYIYHASRIEGEDDLFEVAVSGRVECESCTLLFTADQVRETMQAATERAAKVVEAEAVEETGLGDHVYNLAIKHCAAAIRGTENEGAKGS